MLKPSGNSDGKGVNGFLQDWQRTSPRGLRAKPKLQILAELFTSQLALSAAFQYRPVVGGRNYLYLVDGRWSLSLIAPDEWSDERRAGYAGQLVLQPDMTWTITPADSLARRPRVYKALRQFYEAFADSLDTDRTLEEILPTHASSLPYFQRLYASALSRSMRATVTLGDQAATSCRQWYALLPEFSKLALPQKA